MQGKRLADTRLSDMPLDEDGNMPLPNEMPPGSYWKILSRKTGLPMDVTNNAADRAYWDHVGDASIFAGNLTGTVWGYITPNGLYGIMCVHTVREEDDGTISVRPGDGSSNSILNRYDVTNRPDLSKSWHGYIEHGVWSEC